MLGIMAGWFITIYDALYTSESAYETLKQFDDLYSTVMSNATFKSVSSIMTGIGMSIMLLYFFADLADRVSARRLTTEQLIPPFIKMVFAVFLINNGLNIIGYLVSFGTSLAADMTDEASGATLSEFFSNSDNLSAFKKGLNKIEAKKL